MASREELINDLQRVDDETDSVIDPNQYSFLGSYEFEEIIEKFGTWEQALDEAKISLKSKISEDVLRVNKKAGGSITQPQYRERGNFPFCKIQEEFGTWNNLKSELGLDVHERNIPDKKLEQDMKRVSEKIDQPVTSSKYNELGKYSTGIFILRDYSFSEFRDKIGLEKPNKANPSGEALEAWAERLKDVKGRYKLTELKNILEETGFDYRPIFVNSLKEYLQQNNFTFNVTKGGHGTKYYIEGPEAQTVREYYESYLKQVPNDKEDWFMDMAGTGIAPKTLVAAIKYLTEDKTQKEVADEVGVSEVTVRNTKSKIIERFDLDPETGKNFEEE